MLNINIGSYVDTGEDTALELNRDQSNESRLCATPLFSSEVV